ncbi:PA2169 family four-helix-bundle protein [Hymenobacter sp. BRD128]|uniref:ferritin-like domain-containing protein n=1 Tax=Hymenobacter sp. BRD128 TaxID=2675878 RepID=UPI001567C54B|nr:PA2169 family four-helix-bundle protein [Hymenobacter sp. BRD128]QKG56526.1 PA2169 family four-helix-bundle protein [Hymenobacter sp. BRD128]
MANETIARALTDILNLNRTSVKGYQEAAEEVKNADTKAKLSQFSQQRAGFVSDLEGYAKQYGIDAHDTNTVESLATDAAAAVHRGWINIKSAITGQSDSAVLEAAETGEASALKAYETVLSSNDVPAGAKTVFQQQHDAILQAKNWLAMNKAK